MMSLVEEFVAIVICRLLWNTAGGFDVQHLHAKSHSTPLGNAHHFAHHLVDSHRHRAKSKGMILFGAGNHLHCQAQRRLDNPQQDLPVVTHQADERIALQPHRLGGPHLVVVGRHHGVELFALQQLVSANFQRAVIALFVYRHREVTRHKMNWLPHSRQHHNHKTY